MLKPYMYQQTSVLWNTVRLDKKRERITCFCRCLIFDIVYHLYLCSFAVSLSSFFAAFFVVGDYTVSKIFIVMFMIQWSTDLQKNNYNVRNFMFKMQLIPIIMSFVTDWVADCMTDNLSKNNKKSQQEPTSKKHQNVQCFYAI